MAEGTCCIKGCDRPVHCIGLCASHYVNVAQRYRDDQIRGKNYMERSTIPIGLMLWVRDDPKYYPRRLMHLYTDDDIGELRRAMGRLTHREREIIKMRYGLEDGYILSLKEIGRMFKVTRERVRQLETKALRKLESHMTKIEVKQC
jgi:RNA polymerase sigma factor (sigma-70 family)